MMQSWGRFFVNITGNGTATLSDINSCALELTGYIRDPANWISDADTSYEFTRFLRNDHPLFTNLSGCAAQFVSTSDHMLTLKGSGWVCPQTTGAVFGAAGPQVFTSLCMLSITVLFSCVIQLLLTTSRRQ